MGLDVLLLQPDHPFLVTIKAIGSRDTLEALEELEKLVGPAMFFLLLETIHLKL